MLARPLRAGDSTECNWDALKSCIVSAAEEVVGRWKRKQPDWFEDSEELLSPLIKDKNDAHLRMIQCNTSAKKMEFRRHQRKVKVARPLRAGDSTECNWDALKSCIVSAAEEVVGRWKRKQPDWYEDSEELLSPLIKGKDDAHLRMIQCNTSANQMELRRHQRKVKVAVDNANEEWKL